MLDRFGKRIIVGWAEHEMLWLKAAMTLPKAERLEAYRDIAEMINRTFAAVYYMAARIEYARQEDALKCLRPSSAGRLNTNGRVASRYQPSIENSKKINPIRPSKPISRGRDRASVNVRPNPSRVLRTAFHGSAEIHGAAE